MKILVSNFALRKCRSLKDHTNDVDLTFEEMITALTPLGEGAKQKKRGNVFFAAMWGDSTPRVARERVQSGSQTREIQNFSSYYYYFLNAFQHHRPTPSLRLRRNRWGYWEDYRHLFLIMEKLKAKNQTYV